MKCFNDICDLARFMKKDLMYFDITDMQREDIINSLLHDDTAFYFAKTMNELGVSEELKLAITGYVFPYLVVNNLNNVCCIPYSQVVPMLRKLNLAGEISYLNLKKLLLSYSMTSEEILDAKLLVSYFKYKTLFNY